MVGQRSQRFLGEEEREGERWKTCLWSMTSDYFIESIDGLDSTPRAEFLEQRRRHSHPNPNSRTELKLLTESLPNS